MANISENLKSDWPLFRLCAPWAQCIDWMFVRIVIGCMICAIIHGFVLWHHYKIVKFLFGTQLAHTTHTFIDAYIALEVFYPAARKHFRPDCAFIRPLLPIALLALSVYFAVGWEYWMKYVEMMIPDSVLGCTGRLVPSFWTVADASEPVIGLFMQCVRVMLVELDSCLGLWNWIRVWV